MFSPKYGDYGFMCSCKLVYTRDVETYTECNRIRYAILKIYCDETNKNIATQFVAQHLLTLQVCLQAFNMVAPAYAADIKLIF
jgi:hypothetical protein